MNTSDVLLDAFAIRRRERFPAPLVLAQDLLNHLLAALAQR